MGFPRVPYHMRSFSRRSILADISDPSYLYSRYIRRLVEERIVPVGLETATRTFEAYSSDNLKTKYPTLVSDAREHAAYLKTKYLPISPYEIMRRQRFVIDPRQEKVRQRLKDFLDNV